VASTALASTIEADGISDDSDPDRFRRPHGRISK